MGRPSRKKRGRSPRMSVPARPSRRVGSRSGGAGSAGAFSGSRRADAGEPSIDPLLDSMPDPIAILDRHGLIICSNRAWQCLSRSGALLGSGAEPGGDYVARCAQEIGDRGDAGRRMAEAINRILAGTQTEFEVEHAWNQGGRTLQGRVFARRVDGTHPTAVVIMQQNASITCPTRPSGDQVEPPLREIVGEFGQVCWITQITPERVLYASPAYERIWGRSVEDLYNHPKAWIEVIHPDDQSRVQATFAEWLSRGRIGEWACQYRIVRPDGGIRWISDAGRSIVDRDGGIRRTIGIAEDITTQVEARQGQRRSGELLRTAMERAGVLAWGQDCNLQYKWMINPILHTPENEVVGLSCKDLFTGPEGEQLVAIKKEVLRTGSSIHREQAITVGGQRRIYDLFVDPERDEHGEVTGLTCIAVDITERDRQTRLMEQTQHAAQVGGWELDFTTGSVYWTEETYRLHEVLPTEYRPELGSAIDFYAPESVPLIAQAVKEAAEHARPFDLELRLITARGRSIWVRSIGRVISENGRAVKAYGSFQDISERVMAERALRESEERYRGLIENSPLAIWVDQDGRFGYVNPGMVSLLGADHREQLLGAPVSDRFHAGRRRGSTSIRKAAPRDPLRPSPAREEVMVRLDGASVPVEIYETPCIFAGAPATQVVAMDIRARLEAEQALRESERRLREVLEKVEMAALMLDTQGCIIFGNDYLLRLVGSTREETLGSDWFDRFVPPELRGERREEFVAALETGRIQSYHEDQIQTSSGERRLIGWSNALLRDHDGSIVGATSIGVDLTDQRAAQAELQRHREHLEALVAERTKALEDSHAALRLRERLASVGTLAAGLGHDIANTLLPMRCRLDSLESAARTPVHKQDVLALRQATEYLAGLSSALRMYAADPADQTFAPADTQLEKWRTQVERLFAASVPARIELEWRIQANLPPIVLPAHQLTQAVLNLVLNAVDAISDRGRIEISALGGHEPGVIEVLVSDTGAGMSPEVARQAMDLFYTTKKRGRSTGIGLALVHSVVSGAGGSVEIRTEPGRGTTIVLRIPSRAEPGRGSRVRPVAAVTLADPRRASILTQLLESAGFTPFAADAGKTDGASVWLVEAGIVQVPAIRDFIAADPSRRVVVLGELFGELRGPRILVAEGPGSLSALKKAVRLASGESPD